MPALGKRLYKEIKIKRVIRLIGHPRVQLWKMKGLKKVGRRAKWKSLWKFSHRIHLHPHVIMKIQIGEIFAFRGLLNRL